MIRTANVPPSDQCFDSIENSIRAWTSEQWKIRSLASYEFVPCSRTLSVYHNAVISACPCQHISLSLQYLRCPAMSPTCHLPLVQGCGSPTVTWNVAAQSDWPAGTRNHTRTSPLGSTNLFPFLFSSQLSYKTHLRFLSLECRLKCPQVKKYVGRK